MLFTGAFTQDIATRAGLAFLAMCLVSSSIYIINDLRDIEKDRNHPKKRKRPLAAGDVTPTQAIVVLFLVVALAFGIVAALGYKVAGVIGSYLVLQVIYNFGGKNIPITDVFLIATGFVLRAALGAAAIDVKISGWLLLCTGSLALLLGFGKRRQEFILLGEKRSDTRSSLASYSQSALDALVIITSCSAAMCYGIYALESPTAQRFPGLIYTSPFVVYGICRYIFLVFSSDEGGEPETLLLKDVHLIISVLCFIILAVLAVKGIHVPLLDLGGQNV